MGEVATVLAALIGAFFGSIGAVVVQDWLRRRAEAKSVRDTLVRRHLFLLQDALETLWFRLKNVETGGGREVMDRRDPGYWEVTSLYSLGRVLGVERTLAMEGVYPQLSQTWSDVGPLLRDRPISLGVKGLFKDDLFHYHLLALAEGVLEEDDTVRFITYSEFRRRYDDESSGLKKALAPVVRALDSLDRKRSAELRNLLSDTARAVASTTGVTSRVADDEIKT